MSKPQTTEDWDGEYERLRARLGQIGWLALGTLIERGLPGQGGPRYQWSRRAKGKTVTVALSAEQFAWMKMAVANQREVWEILLRLQQLSAEFMLPNLPGPRRRNRLSKKRFGLT